MKRLALLPLCLLLPLTGCQRSDADRLARVGWKVTEKVQALVPARTPFGGALGLTKSQILAERVRDRFTNDRYLAPIALEINADGNAIRLTGKVNDQVLKQRAIEIASSTVGVESVVDELSVGN